MPMFMQILCKKNYKIYEIFTEIIQILSEINKKMCVQNLYKLHKDIYKICTNFINIVLILCKFCTIFVCVFKNFCISLYKFRFFFVIVSNNFV